MKKGVLFLFAFILLISFSSSENYKIYYYHSNDLGSPVAVTDENADVVWSADYQPFGESFNEFSEENSEGNSYQYNSKELDDSGLLYYNARYYDADIGRFTTADSVKGDIKNPQSMNLYAYVQNNPLKYIDPSGNKIEYLSDNAKERFSIYEKDIYADLVQSEQIYKIGYFEDFADMIRGDASYVFMLMTMDAGGLAIPKTLANKILKTDTSAQYILFSSDSLSISDERYKHIAVHEGYHARHSTMPGSFSKTDVVMRFPEISQDEKKSANLNLLIEEMVTGAKTLSWFKAHGSSNEMIDKELDYFKANYRSYYQKLYGGNMPFGVEENIPNDEYKEPNTFVEQLYRQHCKILD